MDNLKARRAAAGLSQRGLAQRAGVSFRTVQLLEWGRHDARLSTLSKLDRALGPAPDDTASGACAAALAEGPDSWVGPLFDFVDAFRRGPAFHMVEAAPAPDTDARLAALAAAVVETLCAEQGVPVPWWCAGAASLPRPWFVSEMASLMASALVESPVPFRRRNIFVLGNFLDRA